ncbi:GNAT family N-acetyltransferase [Arsenicicoccus dermatophilus]|uniref:GNAT family N-acetyltransferase n=1 Tax=Arsenicicoccus dermatophilus TaxID=1076331 RepID=UPI0039172483
MDVLIADLQPHQNRSARRLLTEAFADDPSLAHPLRHRARRLRGLPHVFATVLANGRRHGTVRVAQHPGTGELLGVATWVPAPHHRITVPLAVRSGMVPLVPIVGLPAIVRLHRLNARHEQLHDDLAPARHVHLHALGVVPGMQGRGIGSALLRDGLTRLDATGTPGYLETHREENVQLYARHGFQVVGHLHDGDLHARCMLRQPR